MSTDRGMDKNVVYIYIHIYICTCNGIFFSQKKERNNVICNSMDEPRDYHKSESEVNQRKTIYK